MKAPLGTKHGVQRMIGAMGGGDMLLIAARPGQGETRLVLQLLLDQQRSKPPLSDQMRSLQEFARDRGVILGFISQIDRSFDPDRTPVPGIGDLRLPNPVPDRIFSKACFRHGTETRFQRLS